MQRIIISDTSCLILLEKIGKIIILKKIFGEVFVTSEITKEFGKPLPKWIKVSDPHNKSYQRILETRVDAGEASAIALAIESENSLLILDDIKARLLASELNLKFTGTIGVLIEGKLAGHIRFIKPILKKIRQTNFRITKELENTILNRVNEI